MVKCIVQLQLLKQALVLLGAFHSCQIKLLALAMATDITYWLWSRTLATIAVYQDVLVTESRDLYFVSCSSFPGVAREVQPGPDQVGRS